MPANQDLKAFIYSIRYPIIWFLSLWIIEIVKQIFGLKLYVLGIYPREWSGLPGIFTAPFVHSGWSHLASNSLPVLSLAIIMVIFYRKVAFQAFFIIMVMTGLLVWFFARPSYHVGASGIIYGFISFIFWTGIFRKNPRAVVLSLIILIVYSGSVESMFPNAEKNVSWESHLFGAVAGLVTSFFFKSEMEEAEVAYMESPWKNDDNEKKYFLPRDVFEKTKLQRYHEWLEQQQGGGDL